jgi:lysyl-tRNA synthetase class 2
MIEQTFKLSHKMKRTLDVVANYAQRRFVALGIPAEWIPVIIKAGYTTAESLKTANPNKLFNDLCGFRKKLKMEIAAPTIDQVKTWVS